MKLPSLLPALATLALVATSCTGDPEPDGPVVINTERPETPVIDCPVEAASPPDAWPLALPQPLTVTEFAVDGNSYIVTGVSNDGDRLLNQSLEQTLADFTVAEPQGGANDVTVTFESVAGQGDLQMSDQDGDGCWQVRLAVTFPSAPAQADFVALQAQFDDGPEPANEGPGAVTGVGTATTGRGTFPLSVSVCSVSPLMVQAAAAEGELQLGEDGGSAWLRWTYEDGTVVEDRDAKAVISSDSSALIVGDGQGVDGPETVIADITCDGDRAGETEADEEPVDTNGGADDAGSDSEGDSGSNTDNNEGESEGQDGADSG